MAGGWNAREMRGNPPPHGGGYDRAAVFKQPAPAAREFGAPRTCGVRSADFQIGMGGSPWRWLKCPGRSPRVRGT